MAQPSSNPHLGHTAAALAERLGGRLRGCGSAAIDGVAAMDEAGPRDITFIANAAHARKWSDCRAVAAVITRGLDGHLAEPVADETRALIEVDDAELALAKVLELFQPLRVLPDAGIHPTAFVHDSAAIGRDVRIGPHVSIGRDATIGDRVVLHAGVRIYGGACLGDECELHAGCVVRERCRLGRRVILHQNVSIGGDGFGYRPAPRGSGAGLVKMPHIGGVLIEDDVEIGSNSCVDRGKFRDTVIGAGTKIDNLVQIAHNCMIGRCCVIAGQVGIAGSVRIGDGVRIGAQAGITEGLTIGDGAQIAAKSGVIGDVPPKSTVMGIPAQERGQTLRQLASLRKLPELMQRFLRDVREG
jgi:UDP-3-O-[3-hydroxymyristoyl] glucosamine N-acyltransferase